MELEAIKRAIFAVVTAAARVAGRVAVLILGPQRIASGLADAFAHVFPSACWQHGERRERLMGRYGEHGFGWLVLQVLTRQARLPFTYELTLRLGQEKFSQINRHRFSIIQSS
jgi:hypothetical protein